MLGELPGKHVVVLRRGSFFDEKIDAVEIGIAEGPVRALPEAAEVGVPDVVGQDQRGLVTCERVVTSDGEGDQDANKLAVLDVVADASEMVARQVELVPSIAVDVEEGHDHRGVHTGVAGLTEGALVLVAAPEDGHLPGLVLQRCHGRASKGADHRNREKCDQDVGWPPAYDRHCYCAFMHLRSGVENLSG